MTSKKRFVGMVLAMLASGLVVSCATQAGSQAKTSYTEGDVYVAASEVLLHYYFSSTPESIEQAVLDNGLNALDPPLKNYRWVENPRLDNNVKKAMNERRVTYSATVYGQDFLVNRNHNGIWYFASYPINKPINKQAPESEDQTDAMELDEGLAQIAREIEEALPEGTRIAVVSLESPSAKLTGYVLDELQGTITNGKKVIVVERENLEPLRKEIDFGMTGLVSDDTAVSLGQFLGADVIITGTFIDQTNRYRMRFNAIRTATGAHEVSPAVIVRRDDYIASLLPSKQNPNRAVDYYNSGFAHYEAKRYREAVVDFTRVLELTSNDIDSLYYRSLSYDLLKNFDGAIGDLTALIRLKPDNAVYYTNRSKAYADKGQLDLTIADLNEAIRLNPNYALAYSNRGGAYVNKGQSDLAIADLNEAIRLNPNNAQTYSNRGAAYVMKGQYDLGIADCNQAIRLDPNNVDAYTNRGAAYLKKGQPDLAIADSSQAIRLNPNNANAYYNRGNAYSNKGQLDLAITDYNQVLRLNPNYANAYYNRGNAYAVKGQFDLAIADLNQAIRLNPNNANAYFIRGYAYGMKGDYVHARADWQQTLKLDPNNADARDGLEALRGNGY